MKTNKLDSFERFVNSSLSGEEVAYNPSDWDDLSNRLNNISPQPFYKKGWFISGAAAIVIGASSFIYYNNLTAEAVETNPIVAIENETNTPKIKQTELLQIEETLTEISTTEEETINKLKPISSETKGKEELVNEPIANHSKPPRSLPISSTTVSKEDKPNTKKEVKIPLPIANYKVKGELSGCKGLEVEFFAEKQDNVTYLWSFGDGMFSTEANPTHQYNSPGTFAIELIVQSVIDGKILTKSEEETNVVIVEDPSLEILKNVTLDKGLTTVNYSYLGDDVTKVYWNLGNGVSSSNKEVATAYKKRGNYKVLLEATSSKGCKSITEDHVFIEEDYNLLAPNTFTPDGDGLNDKFIPEALKTMDCNFTMLIRSRTEGVVFETSSLDRPWDGKSQKTNLECPEDNYIWIVNLTNEKGEKEQYTGTILIKR